MNDQHRIDVGRRNSIFGHLACAALLLWAAGCGGGTSVDSDTRGNPKDGGVNPGPSDAGKAAAALDGGGDAAVPTTEPTGPVGSETADAATPVSTQTATAPETTAPSGTTPLPEPPLPMDPDVVPAEPPSIDWSVLEAPDGCSIETGSDTDDESCSLTLVCDGVRTAQSNCTLAGCYCQTSSLALHVSVDGTNLFDICQASMDFCAPPTAEELEDTTCVPSGGGADIHSCASSESCVLTETYDSGVTATVASIDGAECALDPSSNAGQDGEWQCLCTREGTSYARFYVPGENPALDTCTGAQHLCARFHMMLPETGTTCSVTSEYFSEDSCSSTSSCFIAGTIDGTTVHVDGNLFVNCGPSGEQELSCTVESPLGVTSVSTPRPETVLTACRDLSAEVLAQFDPEGPPEELPRVDAGTPDVPDGG